MDDFEVSLRKYQGMCMQTAALFVAGWVDNRDALKMTQAAAMAHTIINLGNSKECLYKVTKLYAKSLGLTDTEIDEMLNALENHMCNIILVILNDLKRMGKSFFVPGSEVEQ